LHGDVSNILEFFIMLPDAAVRRINRTGPVVTLIITDGCRDRLLERKCRQCGNFNGKVIVAGTLAANGCDRQNKIADLVFLFKPATFPKKRTACGSMAERRSIMVAAEALPIPKLIMVMPSAVADCMGLSMPTTFTLCISANAWI
jgi:hypothetical protein